MPCWSTVADFLLPFCYYVTIKSRAIHYVQKNRITHPHVVQPRRIKFVKSSRKYQLAVNGIQSPECCCYKLSHTRRCETLFATSLYSSKVLENVHPNLQNLQFTSFASGDSIWYQQLLCHTEWWISQKLYKTSQGPRKVNLSNNNTKLRHLTTDQKQFQNKDNINDKLQKN